LPKMSLGLLCIKKQGSAFPKNGIHSA
jgi:hypothetical protein